MICLGRDAHAACAAGQLHPACPWQRGKVASHPPLQAALLQDLLHNAIGLLNFPV